MRAYDKAAEVAGAAGGAALGGSDPVLSASVGAAFTQVIKSVGEDIEERYLAPRERQRLTRSASLIVHKIRENYDAGKGLRSDSFFEANDDRAEAEEIFERTMLAIQRDPQEKKLQLYSNLVANIVFDSSVDVHFGNHLLWLTENLTYRQLCIIALFGGDVSQYSLRRSYREYSERITWSHWSVLQEIYQLCRMRLLNNRDAAAYIDIVDVNPSGTVIDGVANKLFELMEMGRLRATLMCPEIETLIKYLSGYGTQPVATKA
jgi:hypothetical protein